MSHSSSEGAAGGGLAAAGGVATDGSTAMDVDRLEGETEEEARGALGAAESTSAAAEGTSASSVSRRAAEELALVLNTEGAILSRFGGPAGRMLLRSTHHATAAAAWSAPSSPRGSCRPFWRSPEFSPPPGCGGGAFGG